MLKIHDPDNYVLRMKTISHIDTYLPFVPFVSFC